MSACAGWRPRAAVCGRVCEVEGVEWVGCGRWKGDRVMCGVWCVCVCEYEYECECACVTQNMTTCATQT